jgi:hypothetical protein
MRGIYLTEYGNAAYVSSSRAKLAFDLDSQEYIPMALVTDTFIRKAEDCDKPSEKPPKWLRE